MAPDVRAEPLDGLPRLKEFINLACWRAQQSTVLTSMKSGSGDRASLSDLLRSVMVCLMGEQPLNHDPAEACSSDGTHHESATAECLCPVAGSRAPSICRLLAYRTLHSCSGWRAFLASTIEMSLNSSESAWAIRLAYTCFELAHDAKKCIGVITPGPATPVADAKAKTKWRTNAEPIDDWNEFIKCLIKRSLIDEEVMGAVLEILLGNLRIHDDANARSGLGRYISQPTMINVVFVLLIRADMGAWRAALNNFSFLLENESTNCDLFVRTKGCYETILKLFKLKQVAIVSSNHWDNLLDTIGSEEAQFNFKMVVNIFSMILMRQLWTTREGTRNLLKNVITLMENEFGWDHECVSLIRIVLYVIANRFRNAFNQMNLSSKTAASAWSNIVKLMEVVEEFVFHSGIPDHCAVYGSFELHMSKDGSSISDRDLIDACVKMLECYCRSSALDRFMDQSGSSSHLVVIGKQLRLYLAFFCDIACIMAMPDEVNLQSISMLKEKRKRPWKGKLFRRTPLTAAQAVLMTERMKMAMSYRLPEMDRRRPGSLSIVASHHDSVERSSLPTVVKTMHEQTAGFSNTLVIEKSLLTISPRAHSRRIVFRVDSYPSVQAAFQAAARLSGRVRPVYEMMKESNATAPDCLTVRQGDFVCLLEPAFSLDDDPFQPSTIFSLASLSSSVSKLVLVSCRNKTGYVLRAFLSPLPISFEVDVSNDVSEPYRPYLSQQSTSPITSIVSAKNPRSNTWDSTLSEHHSSEMDSTRTSVHLDENFAKDFSETSLSLMISAKVLDDQELGSDDASATVPTGTILTSAQSLNEREMYMRRRSSIGSMRSIQLEMDSRHATMKSGLGPALFINHSRGTFQKEWEASAGKSMGPNGISGKRDSDASVSPLQIGSMRSESAARITGQEYIVRVQIVQAIPIDHEACKILSLAGFDKQLLPVELEEHAMNVASVTSICDTCKISLAPNEAHSKGTLFYCSRDYLNLPGVDCPICHRALDPIRPELSDRMSNGTRCHSSCATCSDCSKERSPIVWEGHVFCWPDFLKQLRHTCMQCQNPIMDERFILLDGREARHMSCGVCCSECKIDLMEQPCLRDPDTSRFFCSPHFTQHLQRMCAVCHKEIQENVARVGPYSLHNSCVQCSVCHSHMDISQCRTSATCYFVATEVPLTFLCTLDYDKQFAPSCPVCKRIISGKAARMRVGNISYHQQCMRCSICQTSLMNCTIYRKGGHLLCQADYFESRRVASETPLAGPECSVCNKPIESLKDGVKIKGRKLHKSCMVCSICSIQLGAIDEVVYVGNNRLFCKEHYANLKLRQSSSIGNGALFAAQIAEPPSNVDSRMGN